MYLNKGKIYSNFNQTERYRLQGVHMVEEKGKQPIRMVRLALLVPPGGVISMEAWKFESQFAEEVETIPPNVQEKPVKAVAKARTLDPYSKYF